MLPIHAALLLGSFVVTASLAVSGLAIARHARSHSDRKAWLLLALAAPSLGVGAMGAVIVPMLWRGCLMFTRFDVHLSLLILAVESALGISALFITYWRARQAAGRLVAIAEPCDDARVRRLLFALCTRMRVALPRVCCVMAERPVAFVTGIFAPRLVLSTWLLAELDDEELEALLAHELV
ncbi:MAG TPA: M48 family metalloprotease, partial [Oscillatoriaceae cyanobacterium]